MALTERDRGLLSRCLQDTPGAGEEFAGRFGGLLTHVVRHTAQARSVPLTADLEEDVAADVLLELLDRDRAALRNFKGHSSLASYLTVIARRTAVRRLTERRHGAALGHVDGHAPPGAAKLPAAKPAADGRAAGGPGTGKPSAPPDRLADREQVAKLLAALPDRDAEIVRRFHLAGESYRQIAAGLNVPENTVGATLTRARAKLRTLGA